MTWRFHFPIRNYDFKFRLRPPTSPDFTRAGHRIVKPTLLLSLFCSTGGIQARMFIKQYSLQYFLIITEYIKNLNKNAHNRADWSLGPMCILRL